MLLVAASLILGVGCASNLAAHRSDCSPEQCPLHSPAPGVAMEAEPWVHWNPPGEPPSGALQLVLAPDPRVPSKHLSVRLESLNGRGTATAKSSRIGLGGDLVHHHRSTMYVVKGLEPGCYRLAVRASTSATWSVPLGIVRIDPGSRVEMFVSEWPEPEWTVLGVAHSEGGAVDRAAVRVRTDDLTTSSLWLPNASYDEMYDERARVGATEMAVWLPLPGRWTVEVAARGCAQATVEVVNRQQLVTLPRTPKARVDFGRAHPEAESEPWYFSIHSSGQIDPQSDSWRTLADAFSESYDGARFAEFPLQGTGPYTGVLVRPFHKSQRWTLVPLKIDTGADPVTATADLGRALAGTDDQPPQ